MELQYNTIVTAKSPEGYKLHYSSLYTFLGRKQRLIIQEISKHVVIY